MTSAAYAQAKRVENLHLTRERDRRRGRELATFLLVGLPVAFVLLAYAALHIETVRVGYAREARARRVLELDEERRRLRAELARASSPDRVVGARGTQEAPSARPGPDPVLRSAAEAGAVNSLSLRRVRWFALFLAFWAAAVVTRLLWVQVAQGSKYRARAQRQQERRVEVSPRRGSILDRSGRELAVSVECPSIYAIPDEVQGPTAVARALAGPLEMTPSEIAAKLSRDSGFVWLKRKVDPDVADEIRQRKLPGIHFVTETKRFYPRGALAAALLGYVGTDDRGLGGLEYSYDGTIRGKPGEIVAADRRAAVALRRDGDAGPAAAGRRDARALDRFGRPVRRRARARRRRGRARRALGDRRSPRSARRRDRGDGERSRLRPEPFQPLSGGRAAQPRHRGRLRAGIDLQDRDGIDRAREASHRARRSHRHGRRHDPRREHDDRRGGPSPLRAVDARRDLRALLQRRHHPRRPAGRAAAPLRRRDGLRRRAFDGNRPSGRERRALPRSAALVGSLERFDLDGPGSFGDGPSARAHHGRGRQRRPARLAARGAPDHPARRHGAVARARRLPCA